jgi:hypothetical protein
MTEPSIKAALQPPDAGAVADNVAFAVEQLLVSVQEHTQHIATAQGISLPSASVALVSALSTALMTLNPASSMDRREVQWRVRVRLYLAARHDEPQADSDPDLPPDKPGATLIAGLPGVAEYLATLATGFHEGATVSGLDEATLRHRLKSLRPTLSRRGGDAVWRVKYKAGGTDWLARVDVERVL